MRTTENRVCWRTTEGDLIKSCVCLSAGCDGELLRPRCDGELGVIKSYCGFGVIELQRAGCDRGLLRVGCDGEPPAEGCV